MFFTPPTFPETIEENYLSNLNLEMIMDIPIELSVEVGRKKLPLRALLNMSQGSIIELDKLADELLELKVNGKIVARGEVVEVNGKFGLRIVEVIDVNERLRVSAKKC